MSESYFCCTIMFFTHFFWKSVSWSMILKSLFFVHFLSICPTTTENFSPIAYQLAEIERLKARKSMIFNESSYKKWSFWRTKKRKKKKWIAHSVQRLTAYSNISLANTMLISLLFVYDKNPFTDTYSFLCRETQNLFQQTNG